MELSELLAVILKILWLKYFKYVIDKILAVVSIQNSILKYLLIEVLVFKILHWK